MIRDGLITYDTVLPSSLDRELPNATLNAIFIAALTTALSYQAAALVFDFFLGCKPRFQGRINDLHTLLLVRKTSPLAVFNNVLRKDWLTRIYYRGDIPGHVSIRRDAERIRPTVTLKLVVMLLAAPVINVIAVTLTFESTRTVTFAEAGFSGMGFGFNDDLSVVDSKRVNQFCSHLVTEVRNEDELTSQFVLCKGRQVIFNDFKGTGDAFVSVGTVSDSEVFAWVGIPPVRAAGVMRGQFFANGSLHVVRAGITSAAVGRVVEFGLLTVADRCGHSDTLSAQILQLPSDGQVEHLLSKNISCLSPRNPEAAVKVMEQILTRVTLVNSDKFEIADTRLESAGLVTVLPFRSGNNIPVLHRRRRNARLPILAVMTGAILLLRAVLALLLRNDTNAGIELLVKSRLGVGVTDSVLQRNDAVISYSSKHQLGDKAYYGLKREDLPELHDYAPKHESSAGVIGPDPAEDIVDNHSERSLY